MTAVWILVAVAVLGVIAYHARMGAVSPRIANPEVTGVPRPVEFARGATSPSTRSVGDGRHDGFSIAVCAWAWRRQPCSPLRPDGAGVDGDRLAGPDHELGAVRGLQPAALALSRRLAAGEPVAHGRALHRDRILDLLLHRPLLREHWILRRLQARASTDSFVWRRPLVSLALLLFVTGFVIDAFLEIFCVSTGLYIYSQVIPWGSLFAGTTFQFPLIWESSLVTAVMIPAGVLCYRDDTGRTQAEKLAQRFRWFPHRPALGTFLMMFAILNVAYFVYGAGFAAIRASGLATAVACPYPFPEAKVYDPQGVLRERGATRPLLRGPLEHLDDRSADGRPTVNPVKEDGYCKPGRA